MTIEQKLKLLIDRLTPVVRDAFLLAIADVSDRVILARLVTAVEAGNYTAAFETLGLSNAAMRPLTAALETSFETMGNAVVQSFPRFVRAQFLFDVRNPRAERWLREQSSSLVTRITEDMRVNVRNVMTTNLEAGNNPRTTALDIIGRMGPSGKREGGIIGLNQPQERWARNARVELQQLNENYFTRERRDKRFDSVVRKAIAEGKPLDKATIDKLITRYKDKLLQLRGETVARTETIQSLNRAQYESYMQGVDAGMVKRSAVVRVWDTAGDTRVRHSHELMDGQEVGLEEPFKAPDGSLLMFPGDTSLGADAAETINCRCRVKFKTDFLSRLDDED